MKGITKICCFIVGWNPILLNECGEASHKMLKRYMAAIVIMSIIWGTIGYFFADKYVGVESIVGKIGVACVFVLIIICIERFIILAVGNLGMMKIFRIVLAILMAVLGATVFDQIIFRQDIDVKIKESRAELINSEILKRVKIIDEEIQQTQQSVNSLQLTIDDLNKKINDYSIHCLKNVSL